MNNLIAHLLDLESVSRESGAPARPVRLVIDRFDQWSNPVGMMLVPSRCYSADDVAGEAAA
jgi:hypothetical protein